MAQQIGYSQVATGESIESKNGLRRMIVSARTSRTSAQPDQLPLAKIREALVSGIALEEFEAANEQGRFVRWLERTCRKAAKHTSNQSDAILPFGRGRSFDARK